MKRIAIAAGLLIMAAEPVQAQIVTRAAATGAERIDLTRSSAGYTYFNRAGADLAQHDEALRACMVEAG
ncbi:hypothetical protein, partial [Brevundimonas sp.]